MKNTAILVRYDGTAYHGWQTQKRDVTVCSTLRQAIEKTVGHPVSLTGCGRTDAGVHAERYVASFRTDSRISMERLPFALNAHLPCDIAVRAAAAVGDSFSAIGSLEKKEYTYRIYNDRHRDPLMHDRAYFYPFFLDTDVMRAAARMFTGTHDFAAVRSVGSSVKTTVRTVYYFDVEKKDRLIELRVCADGFLYNMVRAMVGTLIYASRGKLKPDEIPALLEKGDRSLTGPTVPACGLYMTGLWYREGVDTQWLFQ